MISLAGFSSIIIPGLNICLPLVLWQIWKDSDSGLDLPAKNVINFQISWTIWIILATMISYVLLIVLIGFVLIFVAPIIWFILTFLQTIRFTNGNLDYVPWGTIRFLK